MTKISESEFGRICAGLSDDRISIYKHNPIGTEEETLHWMLLSCLISYLSVPENEMPCFTGVPDVETYRQAILFILHNRKEGGFDARVYLDKLSRNDY